tara:strand:- start:5813 stop:6451 length:639 start_codon:yes stop_codon:yes gene_type:complete
MLPIIGITSDYHKKRHRVGCGYTNAVTLAGGIPVILPAIQDCIPQYKEMCDGFIFTGGDDPVMEEWGIASHPSTTPVHTERQSFELALLQVLQNQPDVPVLGVCLGMQWMGLLAGGVLNQDIEEPFARNHTQNDHAITGSFGEGIVHSHHHQALEEVGELEIIALADDGIIEAVQHPNHLWYKGVQWHPERTNDEQLGQHIFNHLVKACLQN